jgi:carbamoyltransferase
LLRNYIGLSSTFHDPAVAIVNSLGEVVFAEGSERYLQNKRALGAPPDDIVYIDQLLKRYCQPDAEIVVARTWLPWTPGANVLDPTDPLPEPIKNIFSEIGVEIDAPGSLGLEYWVSHFRWAMEWGYTRNTASTNLRLHLRSRANGPQVVAKGTELAFDHHLTHAATACYSSPFQEAVCAVIDANGEHLHANSFFRYSEGRIEPIPGAERAFGSLGLFYIFLCSACRFDHIKGEEWKVMGLAPYGRLDRELYDLMRPMLVHRKLGFDFSKDIMARLTRLLELRRPEKSDPRLAADLAFTGQQLFCEWSKMLLDDLYDLGLSKNVIVAASFARRSSSGFMSTPPPPTTAMRSALRCSPTTRTILPRPHLPGR